MLSSVAKKLGTYVATSGPLLKVIEEVGEEGVRDIFKLVAANDNVELAMSARLRASLFTAKNIKTGGVALVACIGLGLLLNWGYEEKFGKPIDEDLARLIQEAYQEWERLQRELGSQFCVSFGAFLSHFGYSFQKNGAIPTGTPVAMGSSRGTGGSLKYEVEILKEEIAQGPFDQFAKTREKLGMNPLDVLEGKRDRKVLEAVRAAYEENRGFRYLPGSFSGAGGGTAYRFANDVLLLIRRAWPTHPAEALEAWGMLTELAQRVSKATTNVTETLKRIKRMLNGALEIEKVPKKSLDETAKPLPANVQAWREAFKKESIPKELSDLDWSPQDQWEIVDRKLKEIDRDLRRAKNNSAANFLAERRAMAGDSLSPAYFYRFMMSYAEFTGRFDRLYFVRAFEREIEIMREVRRVENYLQSNQAIPKGRREELLSILQAFQSLDRTLFPEFLYRRAFKAVADRLRAASR